MLHGTSVRPQVPELIKAKEREVWLILKSSMCVCVLFSCVRVSSKHAEYVSSVAWASKSNNFVVSGCKNGVVSLFNTRDACRDGDTANVDIAFEASLHAVAHTKDINSIAVSPDDTLIATGSQDRTIKVRTI